MFLGFDDPATEAKEVRRNAEVNRACERFGMVPFLSCDFFASKCPDILESHHELRPAISEDARKRVASQDASKGFQCSPITPPFHHLL
jgi:hypothetical protein